MLHRPAEAEEKEEKHMGYMEEYKFWLEAPYFDPKTKEELKGIEGNEAEIEDRFYKELEFGTGGLRNRRGNQPHEHLYGKKGHTGPGKLYFKAGRREKGRGNCL